MPSHTKSSRPSIILNLNGGGIRGYASLCMLQEVERKCKEILGDDYTEDIKPCNLFDIIGGVSTGAIIALMLGRLEMTIEECKLQYESFANKVFGAPKAMVWARQFVTVFSQRETVLLPYRFNPEALEDVISRCLENRGLNSDEPLVPDVRSIIGHKSTVVIPVVELHAEVNGNRRAQELVLTSIARYKPPEQHEVWTIKQAIMAATAAPTYFPAFEHPDSKRAFVDAALYGYSNPAVLVYQKMKEMNRHKKEGLLLDVGTGSHDRILLPFKTWKNVWSTSEWISSLLSDTRQPAQTANILCNGASGDKTYYRLDVTYPSKCKTIKIYHHQKLAEIQGYVKEHVAQEAASTEINGVSRRIAEVVRGEFYSNRTLSETDDQLSDPCNKAGSDTSVCFYNPRNKKFLCCCESEIYMPYTARHMPEEFVQIKRATGVIKEFYDKDHSIDRKFDKSRMDSVITDLCNVLARQQAELELPQAQDDPTLLSEFALAGFKLVVAYEISENSEDCDTTRSVVKNLIAVTEGRQSQHPMFISPCEWFSQQKKTTAVSEYF